MLRCVLLVLCAAFVFCNSEGTWQFEGHQVLRVQVQSKEQVDILKNIVDHQIGASFWTERIVAPGAVDIQLSPEILPKAISILVEASLPFTIVHENIQQAIEENMIENARAKESGNFFDSYASFEEMEAYLKNLQSTYPEISSLVQVGQTLEGRNITGIVISNGKKFNKTKIVINGCQHAREWISPMTVAYIAQYLTQNYTTDSTVSQLVNDFEWTIIPIVNADGYVFTWTDNRLWRKNRRENQGSPCYGVDINRNWDFEWGSTGTSKFACADTFSGPSGFSEPEETALANYISSLTNVVAYIDFHAYGELFMYPWGYVCDTPTPDATTQNIGAKAYANAVLGVNGLDFTTGPICDTIYPASGDSADWTYGVANVVYSYACELRGDSFVLPPEEIIPSGEETFAGIIAWATYIDSQVNSS